MSSSIGWAIFNKHGQPILDSLGRTRLSAISWASGAYLSGPERQACWKRWKSRGFTCRKVEVRELSNV